MNEESRLGSWKRKLARKLIDSGANVYVGHGDPRLQGIEIYRGCLILYCLGSLFFQTKTEVGFYGSEVWESVIVQLHCHRDGQRRGGKGGGGRGEGGTASKGEDGDELKEEQQEGEGEDGSVSSYSVKLIPIVLNEVGDGYDHAHEHVLIGNVVQEQQRAQDAEMVAKSRPSSPFEPQLTLSAVSPLVLPSCAQPPVPSSPGLPLPPAASAVLSPPSSSDDCASVPGFLAPAPAAVSLGNAPARRLSLSAARSDDSAAAASAATSILSSVASASSSSCPVSPRFVPPLSPSPLGLSSSYALHLSTRGLPRLASREQSIAILQRLQRMSDGWGTVIEIDEGEAGGEQAVVGWVSTSREEELQHPFLRPRASKPLSGDSLQAAQPNKTDTRATTLLQA